MIVKFLERTGLIGIFVYMAAVGYVIFFWFLFNVVCRNYRRKYGMDK